MTTPATILRDTAIAGLVLSLLGAFAGVEFAGAVAAGALASLVNLGLLVRLVNGGSPGGVFLARLLLKHVAGAVLLLLLVATLPAGTVVIGFCSALLALAFRALTRSGGSAPLSPPELG